MAKTVLLVDDDIGIREVLTELLLEVEPKAKVDVFHNGFSAFLNLPEQRYDLLITDLRMPGSSGEDLFASIRLLKPEKRPKRVLVFSGFIQGPIGEIEGVEIQYLDKPSNPTQIKQVLAKMLA